MTYRLGRRALGLLAVAAHNNRRCWRKYWRCDRRTRYCVVRPHVRVPNRRGVHWEIPFRGKSSRVARLFPHRLLSLFGLARSPFGCPTIRLSLRDLAWREYGISDALFLGVTELSRRLLEELPAEQPETMADALWDTLLCADGPWCDDPGLPIDLCLTVASAVMTCGETLWVPQKAVLLSPSR